MADLHLDLLANLYRMEILYSKRTDIKQRETNRNLKDTMKTTMIGGISEAAIKKMYQDDNPMSLKAAADVKTNKKMLIEKGLLPPEKPFISPKLAMIFEENKHNYQQNILL